MHLAGNKRRDRSNKVRWVSFCRGGGAFADHGGGRWLRLYNTEGIDTPVVAFQPPRMHGLCHGGQRQQGGEKTISDNGRRLTCFKGHARPISELADLWSATPWNPGEETKPTLTHKRKLCFRHQLLLDQSKTQSPFSGLFSWLGTGWIERELSAVELPTLCVRETWNQDTGLLLNLGILLLSWSWTSTRWAQTSTSGGYSSC